MGIKRKKEFLPFLAVDICEGLCDDCFNGYIGKIEEDKNEVCEIPEEEFLWIRVDNRHCLTNRIHFLCDSLFNFSHFVHDYHLLDIERCISARLMRVILFVRRWIRLRTRVTTVYRSRTRWNAIRVLQEIVAAEIITSCWIILIAVTTVVRTTRIILFIIVALFHRWIDEMHV